ncbi:hypothetical protein BGX38DRAFT_1145553 [Terfezia claveryi]|nr:hypothetical protein BGX38DRAFT_1145553 [Terfezia claveryi]
MPFSYLLDLFCYQSAYGQDARIIADVTRRLSTDSSYVIFLKDFARKAPLYPSDNREWTQDDSRWTQDDLSSVLRNYRLLQTLEILRPEGLPKELQEDYERRMETPLQILKYYHDLQSKANLNIMLNRTAGLIECLNNYVSYNRHRLKTYSSSIISLVEELGTLLLFCGWRSELLIPKSWGIMYLPRWVQFLASHSETLDESHRTDSRKAMYELTWMFLNMVDLLQGKQYIAPYVREVLARRSVDFFAIVLVNIGMISPLTPKYKELFADVQKSLKTKTIHNVPSEPLLKSLMNAFTYYNGKDHLCLHICGEQPGSIHQSGRTAWLKTLGIEVQSRPDIISEHKVISPRKTSSTLATYLLKWNAANLIRRAFRNYQRRKAEKRAQAATRIQICTRRFLKRKAEQRAKAAIVIQTAFRMHQRRREEKRVKAVIVIQRVYRKYERKKAVQKAQGVIRRACMRYKRDKGYFRSPEGTAVAKIQQVFQEKRKAKPKLTTKEYLKLLVVMLTQGVSLYIDIESLYSKYTAIIALKNRHSSRPDVKRLFMRIDGTRTTLFQASPKFNATLDLSEEGLRKRILDGKGLVGEARKMLKDIEDDNRKEEGVKAAGGSINQQQTTTSHSQSQVQKPVAGGNKMGDSKVVNSKVGDSKVGDSKVGDSKAGGGKNSGGGKSKGGGKKGGGKKKTYGKGKKRK